MYEIKETQVWGPNVIYLHLMMGAHRFYIVGCYIPPSDLDAWAYIDQAWCECPKGAHPILVGDLNLNLRAPHTEREEIIAKQVDAMDLVDMSRHYRKRSGKRLRGRWTWRMKREGDGSPLSATTSWEGKPTVGDVNALAAGCLRTTLIIARWAPLFTLRGGGGS